MNNDIIAPPEEGEIERDNAYYRINPSGHKELVINRKGKPDEETLNELAEDILEEIHHFDEYSDFPESDEFWSDVADRCYICHDNGNNRCPMCDRAYCYNCWQYQDLCPDCTQEQRDYQQGAPFSGWLPQSCVDEEDEF